MRTALLWTVLVLGGGATCNTKSCSAKAESAGGRGGTLLKIPVAGLSAEQEKSLGQLARDLKFEFFQCPCKKEQPDAWRYDRCGSCGKSWSAGAKKLPGEWSNVDKGSLLFNHGGDFEVLYVARLSAVEKIVREAGGTVQRKGSLAGPFAVHVGRADVSKLLPALQKLPGVGKVELAGGILYLNQDRSQGRVKYESLEKLFREHQIAIEDLSWVVHRCYGIIGFLER